LRGKLTAQGDKDGVNKACHLYAGEILSLRFDIFGRFEETLTDLVQRRTFREKPGAQGKTWGLGYAILSPCMETEKTVQDRACQRQNPQPSLKLRSMMQTAIAAENEAARIAGRRQDLQPVVRTPFVPHLPDQGLRAARGRGRGQPYHRRQRAIHL